MLESQAPQMKMFKHRSRKREEKKQINSIYSWSTKGTAREEASVSSIGKGVGVQQHMGHTSKRHSIRGKRLEDKIGGSDICRV